jgi:hypothetical protein
MDEFSFDKCHLEWLRLNPRDESESVSAWRRRGSIYCADQQRQANSYWSEVIRPSRSEGYSKAEYPSYEEPHQPGVLTVSQERKHAKQNKLNRIRERYTRT